MRRCMGIVGFFVLAATATFATTVYWDNNGATAGFGAAGGTWGSDVKWSTNALGSTAPDQPVNTADTNLLHFGTGTDGLTAGTVTVAGSQSFDRISFGVASAPITLSGGTLELVEPASTVCLNSITNTLGSVLALAGGLSVCSHSTVICDGFPVGAERVLFANARLSDYTGVEAKMGGAWIASASTTPTAATVYHWNNDGTNASFQVQCLDGGHTKVVKIELRQDGAHIVGKAAYAKHCSATHGNKLGNDFDSEGDGSTIATWFSANGYGCAELKLLPYDDRFTEYRYHLFLTQTAQTIATDASLADFATADCFMAGGSVNDDLQPASTFYFVNDGATATFQAQSLDDGYTKCVKVELSQAGSDIQARILYAKYVNGDNLGHNFDLSGNNSNMATSIGANGYGVRSIRLRKGAPTLRLTADSDFEGPISVTGATLRVEGLLGTNGISGNVVIADGSVVSQPHQTQKFSGTISGIGTFVVDGSDAGETVTYSSTLTAATVVIATNKSLADFGNASGVISGGNVNGGRAAVLPHFFENDGTTATVQLQVFDGGHTKVVKVECAQVGSDIQAWVVYSKHCSAPHGNNEGTDYDTTGLNNNYALTQFSLLPVGAKLTGNSSYSGGTIVNGCACEVTSVSSLPDRGGIVVNGGALILNASPNAGINSVVGGMSNPITVFAGGRVTLVRDSNAGYDRSITVDGGLLENNAITYMNNVTLKNGGVLGGTMPFRVGYLSLARIGVSGTAPSYVSKGMHLVNAGGMTLTLDVEDATEDSATDLGLTGSLTDLSGYAGLPLIKAGDGTASLGADNSFSGTVTVNAGTLALGADSALDSNTITLNGGGLDMGVVSNTVGTLTVGASGGTLVPGTGTLLFADSSAISWTGILTLTNTLVEGTVRFGTDDSGLTQAQLDAIQYDGPEVRMMPNGYLTALPYGTVISVR